MSSKLIKRLKYCSALLGACLVFAAITANAQTFFNINNNHKRVNIPFRFIRNMVVVQIKINNKGPYNFVLDTGVGLVIITDPKLIDSLDITTKRLIKITGLGGGEDYEAYVTPSVNLSLPGITGNNIPAAILKKDQFSLSNYAGIPIHGLLGYEFFYSFAVKVDFNDSTLTVGALHNLRIFKHSDKLPISIEDHKPYFTTNVKFTDGKQLNAKLVIDLGAGHPLLLENQANVNYQLAQKLVSANLGMGLTGPISGFLCRINQLDLGKYKLQNIITSFPDDNPAQKELSVKRDGNLGINILKRFNLVIDYQSGAMYIKPNANYKQPFEHDMTGIEYYADGPGYKHIIINRIERGSPADEAGLETGDEILGINFKPIEKMNVEEIDDIFQSRDDRSILLEILHRNKRDWVNVRLKKRI